MNSPILCSVPHPISLPATGSSLSYKNIFYVSPLGYFSIYYSVKSHAGPFMDLNIFNLKLNDDLTDASLY